ncbi:MAG: hypothetical protein RIC19_23265 [Phaeodactylibacter sp.]|uniref:hypothetical protein n=1 Tax=Phaeodactylibacter sp. TaxID=1940289 RepID=UPI0032ED44BC
MKKPNTRTVIFSLALAASISAYTFLNVVSTQLDIVEDAAIEEMDYEDRVESESGSVVLPDVRLIKKVFEVGKRFLPAS